ncbi:MAG TPA: hypothetical protein VGK14_09640 [Novimethylophilus sp.]|uniref:hypothetical protein n=1 Tax=Novimethylophilus sp. TaxID=2137426 RepID=UPI002F427AFE
MAAFRGLTAEEEAASGFMHCLKERGYLNAERLNPKDHTHKNAIAPFLDVLGLFFAETTAAHVKKPALMLQDEGGERRLMLGLLMSVNGEDQWVHPIPPLNFTISSEDKRLSYRRQIEFLASHRGAKSISAYIRTQANLRNQLLYAGPEGYPGQVDLSPDFFEVRKVRVMALVRGYLLVQPYQERLSFVQDSLDAFLAMLGELKDHDLHEDV